MNQSEPDPNALSNPIGDPLVDPSLGLDSVKIRPKRKIAKIDNDRILYNKKGIPYLVKNHQRLNRIIAKNDKEFQKSEHNKASVNRNYRTPTQLKYDHEYSNLTSILQFYQLWCHGMFPKANFKDCAYLIRSLGHKSSQLRLYRRELIDKEIHKLKVSKGIIDENSQNKDNNNNLDLDDELYSIPRADGVNDNSESTSGTTAVTTNESNDVFFGFMEQDKGNDERPAANTNMNQVENDEDKHQDNEDQSLPPLNSTNEQDDEFSDNDNDFDDDDEDIILAATSHKSTHRIVEEEELQPTQQEMDDMEMEMQSRREKELQE
ncbi:CSM3 [Candida pseudojiufengensis]|uniref:CSM3 n=1 Tax=Candida pseudojiufengensis TaxID=497109 RepID=UPI0022255FC5|nr:CSM3 [Candida pseudojiufengensis]KAI5966415.1 CSM3 [Candida pseudojiufengensis]